MSELHIPRLSLNAEVVARLRHEIVEGLWKPGERLQERILCERFGISRSPLREAYQVLAADGLLDILPNRGAVVSSPSPKVIVANYELLGALEVLAIELASKQATDAEIDAILECNASMKKAAKKQNVPAFMHLNNDVHRLIVKASGNQPLIDTHEVIARQIIRVQNLDGPLEHGITESVDEHDEFLLALKARKTKAAADLLKSHLKTVRDNLVRRLRPYAADMPEKPPARRRARAASSVDA